VIRLNSADAYTSRWTWYQNGKEDWMEEIEHRRAKKASGEETAPHGRATPGTKHEHP
jgi:hypothetical protein